MKNYKVLIGGYDFEQKIHRGITYYGKALINTLRDHDLYLLTSAKREDEEALLYLNILRQLDDPIILSSKKRLLAYIKSKLSFKYDIVKNELTNNNVKEKLNYLKYINYYYNIPRLYDITGIHNRFFLKNPLKIDLDKSLIDLLILTSPTNIKANVPTIQTLHDVIPLTEVDHPPADSSKIFYYRIKNMLEYSEKIFSVSEYSKQMCIKLFPEAVDKIEVVHQPIPIYDDEKELAQNSIVQNSVLTKYGLESENYLFYVGMLEKRKNIKLLIESYLAVADKVNIPLVLAGALGYGKEEFISYLKDDRYKGKIIYLNYISNIEKLVLLKNARAFVFPSLSEGFGLPPLESMSMDTPVLTSNVTSLPEVCGNAALLVNPYSIKELAEGIENITLNNQLREDLLKESQKNIKRFTYTNFRENINRVVDNL